MSRQHGDPWHRKLFVYAVGALIWMILLALLYLYLFYTAPEGLKQERKESRLHLTIYPG
ncbi:MAG: hypothetical protein ACE5I8_12160 [Thermodesulfobacteriota bacterium]